MDALWDRSFNCRGNRERLPWSGSVRRTSLDRVADDGMQAAILLNCHGPELPCQLRSRWPW